MDKILSCSCGNSKSGDRAKECSKCGKITCQRCSFTGCNCGSTSYRKQLVIGK